MPGSADDTQMYLSLMRSADEPGSVMDQCNAVDECLHIVGDWESCIHALKMWNGLPQHRHV